MARAIWKGRLSIGKEKVPVKLYSAVEDRTMRFRLLHESDLCPVVRKQDGRTVSREAFRKACRSAPTRGDPDSRYVGALVAADGYPMLITLRRADPVYTFAGVERDRHREPSASELRLAKATRRIDTRRFHCRALAGRASTPDLQAHRCQSTRRADRAARAQAPHQATDEHGEDAARIVDLMQVLSESLSKRALVAPVQDGRGGAPATGRSARERTRQTFIRRRAPDERAARTPRAARPRRTPRANSRTPGDLTRSTKAQLQELAAALHIAGRSKLDKRALLDAIRRAG